MAYRSASWLDVAVIEDSFVTCPLTPGSAFEPTLAGDGASFLEVEVPAGSSRALYVIVANDRLDVPVQGAVAFEALPQLEWTFDRDLEGWLVGGAVGNPDFWGSAEWRDFCGSDRPAGCVKLDGLGGVGSANAWIYRSIELPADVTTLRFDTSAHNRDGADSEYRVLLVDDPSVHVLVPWTTTSGAEGVYLWETVQVDISAFAGTTVAIYLEGGDNAPGEHEQRYYDNVAID